MSKWAFMDFVTDVMARPRRGDSKSPTLWPSEATATATTSTGATKVIGRCRRQRFFRYLIESFKYDPEKYQRWEALVTRLNEEKKPVDTYMRWIWNAGELYEEHLINQAKAGGVYVADQVPVYIKNFNVSGKKDIEIFNPATGKYSIVEAKSVYGHGASAVLGTPAQRNAGGWGSPKEAHLMQLGLYHWWTASEDNSYEDSRLVYGARDNGHFAEFLLRTTKVEIPREEPVPSEDEAEAPAPEYINYIEYKPHTPNEGPWVRTDITIESILEEYAGTQAAVDGEAIVPRDYTLQFDEGQLQELYDQGQLPKTDAAKFLRAKAILDWNDFVESIADMEDSDLLSAAYDRIDSMTAAIKNNYEEMIELHGTEDEKLAKKYERAKARNLKALRALKPKKRAAPIARGNWQCQYCAYARTCYDENKQPREL